MTSRKLKTLSVKEKFKIIEAVELKEKEKQKNFKSALAKEFNIPTSTLSTILKNKTAILERYYAGDCTRKRKRDAEFPDLETALLTWFKQCRDQNVSISGVVMREKALDFAKKLGYESFNASVGWLDKFKSRHGIVFRKLCGESGAVDQGVCDEWIEKLTSLIKTYKLEDIYNADETGMFFEFTFAYIFYLSIYT